MGREREQDRREQVSYIFAVFVFVCCARDIARLRLNLIFFSPCTDHRESDISSRLGVKVSLPCLTLQTIIAHISRPLSKTLLIY